jgi:hypothetical protein
MHRAGIFRSPVRAADKVEVSPFSTIHVGIEPAAVLKIAAIYDSRPHGIMRYFVPF